MVYVEAAEESSYDIGRRLHGMKLAGWFADANGALGTLIWSTHTKTLTQMLG